VAPLSLDAIRLQQFSASSNEHNESIVTVTNLQPLTKYTMMCYRSFMGHSSSLIDTVRNSWIANTTCCIPIVVTASRMSFTVSTSVFKFLSITLVNYPSALLQLKVTVNGSSIDNVFPSIFHLNKMFGGDTTLVTYLRPSIAGVFSYSVVVEGPSAKDYTVQYSNGKNSFSVVTFDQQSALPIVASAVFSDDASFLIISFDSPTNKGCTKPLFSCHALFDFICANTSQCQWMDTSTVHAYINSVSSQCVAPGDSLHILETASIKAPCEVEDCICPSSSWANSSRSSITALGPKFLLRPIPVINSPSALGACDDLTLDLSASTGSGGRSWTSTSIRVSCGDAAINLDLLQKFVDGMTVFYPPTPIPYFLFVKGHSYEFTVRLCNFLGGCGESFINVVALNATIPSINLPGNPIRSVKRNTMLTVVSLASLQSCSQSSSSKILNFEWSVFSNSGVKQSSLLSITNDQTKFLLPSYSLNVSFFYNIQVTVSVKGSHPLKTSSASILVYVTVGSIVAVIKDGVTKNMRVLTTTDIDASSSYDEDKVGLTGVDAGLAFYWSCRQVDTVFRESCSASGLNLTSSGSLLRFRAAESSAGNMYLIELTIIDPTDLRLSRISVSVSVVSAASVVVNTVSNFANMRMNPGQSLQLNGLVSMPMSLLFNTSVQWSVNDDAIPLSRVTMSPIVYHLMSSSNTNYLVLPPNTLLGGSTLTFNLRCISVLGEVLAVSALTIVVNSSPKPGKFMVSPLVGTELKDIFLFGAQQWMDADLPLYYQFAYISSTETVIVLQSRSALSYGHSHLPAGLDSTSNAVVIVAQILDELHANSSTSSIVRVLKGPALTLTDIVAFISLIKNRSEFSVDEIKRHNALSLYLVNSVNCSLAPNCSALNRKSCLKTTNTCGACKSNAFIGDTFDSNSPCYLPEISLSASTTLRCRSLTECRMPRVCINQICVFPSKNCTNHCSGHGTCVLINVNSGISVSDCTINDEQCAAKCNCEVGYVGSQWCDLRSDELVLKQGMREEVLDNVNYLISQEYPDQFVISGWISALVDATKSSDELNDVTMLGVLVTVNTIVQVTTQSTSSNDVLTELFSAINSAASYLSNQPVKKESGDMDSYARLNQTLLTLSSITVALSTTLVPGQDPIRSSQSCFRATLAMLPASVDRSTTLLSLPQSQSESLLNIPTSSLSIQSIDSLIPIHVSLVTLRSSYYRNGTNFQANPLNIFMSSSPCGTSKSSCTMEIHLQNSQLVLDGNQSTVNHEKASTFCATLLNGQVSNQGIVCRLTNVTAFYSVCSCDLAVKRNQLVKSTHSRLLQDSLNVSSHSVELSVTTLLHSVIDRSKSTLLSAADLNESKIQKEWTVLVTLGTLILTVTMCMVLGHKYDSQIGKTVDINIATVVSKLSMNPTKIHSKKRRLAALVKESSIDEVALLEESLPRVLGDQPFTERFLSEVKQHHRWVGVACFYSDSFPRSLRVLSLATNVIVMLFVQSITYNLTKPDDGSCGSYISQSACLEPQSSLGIEASKCAWKGGSCVFVEQATSFTVVLFVAILSAVLSTPIAYLQDYLIFEYLAAPVRQQPSNNNEDSVGRSTVSKSIFA